MVLATLRSPKSGAYIVQDVCEWDVDPPSEPPDLELLRKAWIELRRRYPALRTRIQVSPSGTLMQSEVEHPPLDWAVIDAAHVPLAERTEHLADCLNQDRSRGFDLTASVPCRITVIRYSARCCTIVWTTHHVILDGRSYFLLWNEWFQLYKALVSGNGLPSAEPRSFREHVEHVQWLDQDAARTFWREHLSDLGQNSGFVIDRLRPALPDSPAGSARVRTQFSGEMTAAIHRFTSEHKVTANTIVLGAWALLLSRYSDQESVIFGVTRSGRQSSVEGASQIAGCFVSTLPFRVKLPEKTPVAEYLRGIRGQWVEMRAYEHTPLQNIIEYGGLNSSPVFDTLVSYEHQPLDAAAHTLGADWSQRTLRRVQRTDIPLTLVAYGNPQFVLELIYDSHTFSAEFANGILRHLSAILQSFLIAPAQPLSEVRLLSESEEVWLLHELNRTSAPFPEDTCAYQWFERHAAESPEHVALEEAERTLTYGELNHQADRLALHLRTQGVGPEDLIVLHMDRCTEAVIGVLGIQKAGAAFLPLPSSVPAARVEAIITSTHPKLILTVSDVTAVANHQDLSADSVIPVSARDHAAYAILTSGSTGTPKTVVVTHRSLMNYAKASAAAFGVTPSDRRLQFASFGSDVFVAEVFTYLTSGATLVFSRQREGISAREFMGIIDSLRITVTGIPSSWWNQWVAAMIQGDERPPRSLRLVLTGMERVDPETLLKWKQVAPGIRLMNIYGPTETTLAVTFYESGSSEWEGKAFVPIGTPIANISAYVLDKHGRPVPVGIPGELFIGGVGVARGYLNDPELTSQRFLPDSFSSSPGKRLYRTGDRVLRLPDGNLVFVGRADEQVKIRGFRIEPSEVETALARHPAIVQSAVVACGEPGRQYLTAFYTTDAAPAPDAQHLRAHLAALLPPHMIPAAFVPLKSLPVSPSGKVDRLRLATLEATPAPALKPTVPGSKLESRLFEIWAELLHRNDAGLRDHFFDVGGDSLGATSLLTQIHIEFDVDVSMAEFVQNPTIEALVTLLSNRTTQHGESVQRNKLVAAFREQGSLAPLCCISSAPTDIYRFRKLAGLLGGDQPIYGISVPEPRDANDVTSVEVLAAEIVEALRAARPSGPYVLGGYCFGGVLAVEAARQLTEQGERVSGIILFDVYTPGYPKLLRATQRYPALIKDILAGRLRVGSRDVAHHLEAVARISMRQISAMARRVATSLGLHSAAPASAPDLTQDAMARLLAARMYQPQAIHVPVTHFIASQEEVSTRALDDPRLGWSDFCRNGFQVHAITGSHAEVLLADSAGEVGRLLAETLKRMNPPEAHLDSVLVQAGDDTQGVTASAAVSD